VKVSTQDRDDPRIGSEPSTASSLCNFPPPQTREGFFKEPITSTKSSVGTGITYLRYFWHAVEFSRNEAVHR